MLYFADRISDNIRKREPEGYLICVNVPIARSGTQRYLNDEVGRESESKDDEVTVYRPEEEVFSDATIASFEGMPVTNDHPDADEGVTADNIQWLQKGHCQNVHRGSGNEKNMLIADLVITDPATIKAVLDGKREISCGYNYELCEEDGKLVQRQIRGNHIAIVDKGRAGHRVCIKDSAPTKERSKPKMAKTKHGIWAKMLAKFAVDADPEEVAEAVEAIDEMASENEESEAKATDAEVSEKLDELKGMIESLPAMKSGEDEDEEEEVPAEKTEDEEPDKLDKVIALLEQLIAQKGADCGTNCKKGTDEEPEAEPEEEKDPMQELEDDLEELEKAEKEEAASDEGEEVEEEEGEVFAPDEDPDEPESHFVDPEEINEEDEDETAEEEEEAPKVMGDRLARDAARAAIKAVKPVIAKLPTRQRKVAADAAMASIRKACGLTAKPVKNSYSDIRRSQLSRKATDSKTSRDISDKELSARIRQRNANYKK